MTYQTNEDDTDYTVYESRLPPPPPPLRSKYQDLTINELYDQRKNRNIRNLVDQYVKKFNNNENLTYVLFREAARDPTLYESLTTIAYPDLSVKSVNKKDLDLQEIVNMIREQMSRR